MMSGDHEKLSVRMKNGNGRYQSHEFKGTIIPAYGGHIVRSTGRKDRHSKVVTAKGVRDRRVRLSAHTAIQFYDIQDRLGYDRPSKAVDWLMHHAKAAIDRLAQLPREIIQAQIDANSASNDCNDLPTATEVQSYKFSECSAGPANIFPVIPSAFQNSMSKDLRLSLQSLQEEQMMGHDQHLEITRNSGEQTFCAAETIPTASWNAGGSEFVYSVALPTQAVQLGHQFYAQREPLQSSYSTPFQGWVDSLASSTHASLIPITRKFVTANSYGGILGFAVPERFHGEDDAMPETN